MSSNYWSQKLGFVDDAHPPTKQSSSLQSSTRSNVTGSAAVMAAASAPPIVAAATRHELDSLESWIAEFDQRTAEKEQRNQANALAQLVRDSDQIERWNLFRKEQAAKEKAEEDAKQAHEELFLQQKLEQERQFAEERRIAASTEGLTEEQREQWIRDEQELFALEQRMAKQQTKLEHFDQIMKQAAEIYDREREAERVEQERIDAECAAACQRLLAQHATERDDYLRHANDDKDTIVGEEESLRRELAELMEVAKKELVADTRAKTLASAAPEERARLEALDEATRMDILDEMATLAMLKRRFSSQVGSGTR